MNVLIYKEEHNGKQVHIRYILDNFHIHNF